MGKIKKHKIEIMLEVVNNCILYVNFVTKRQSQANYVYRFMYAVSNNIIKQTNSNNNNIIQVMI